MSLSLANISALAKLYKTEYIVCLQSSLPLQCSVSRSISAIFNRTAAVRRYTRADKPRQIR
jgi:hypothetical protein